MPVPVVDSLLGALAPARCLLCDQPCPGAAACPGCLADLPWLVVTCSGCGAPLPGGVHCGACPATLAPYARAWSALAYEYPVDRLITAAKFGGELAVAAGLGELLAGAAAGRPRPPRGSLLVPVPLHWRRQAARGYNQAEEIARPLARRLGYRLAGGLCRRARATPPQASLGSADRRANLTGAFTAGGLPAGATVIVLDDVLTTGATAGVVGEVLRAAGAGRLEFWSVARAVLRQPAARKV